jgi:putative ABC transport system permease protein
MNGLLRRMVRWGLGDVEAQVYLSELDELYRHKLEVEGRATAARWQRQQMLRMALHAVAMRIQRAAAPGKNLRRARILDGYVQDTRFAVRTLCKRPLFATTVVLTLAMGIGATTSVFSVADALLFRPLPFPEPQELLYVPLVVPPFGGRPELEVEWSYPEYRLLTESANAFEETTTYWSTTSVLTGPDDPQELQVELVGSGYFSILGIKMVEGRAFLREEDESPGAPFVAILSHDLWVRAYGADSHIVGRSIYLHDRPYTVVGVAQAGFHGLTPGGAQVWVPLMTAPASVIENPDNHAYTVLARLKDGVSLERARPNSALSRRSWRRRFHLRTPTFLHWESAQDRWRTSAPIPQRAGRSSSSSGPSARCSSSRA